LQNFCRSSTRLPGTHGSTRWYPSRRIPARRAEILRARIDDIDFEGETVLIREKKREKDRWTTRRAPLSPQLAGVLKQWLKEHPGGQHLFCHAPEVARSRKRSATTGHKGEKARASSLKAGFPGCGAASR
jgi:integrase